jgi:hypothetical protein
MKRPPALLAALQATLPATLLAAHVLFGLCRAPLVTVARRAQEIAEYRREGDIAYVMRTSHLQGADALVELRRTTPPDHDVRVRGDSNGPLEFAPALLWPRLCYHRGPGLPVLSERTRRPMARHTLVADGNDLRLDPP